MAAALWLVALAALSLPPDIDPPQARIDFPLPSALTDATTMRVRGSASDASGVAAVRVNGVPASTVDGFASWWAVVPLELGENVLAVETLDVAGNLDPAAATTVVRRDGAIVRRPQGLALDPLSGNCFVFDWLPDGSQVASQTRILAADLATGALEVVSSRSKGSGPLPRYASGEMDYDPLAKRLLLVDINMDRLIAVEVATGDRSVVSGVGVGSGPPLQGAIGLELDPEHGRAWVFNRSFGPTSGALLSVDLATGNRTTVSSPTVGKGPWPQSQSWMTRAPDGNRLLVTCFLDHKLLGIDLASGDRSIVSDTSSGLGSPWSFVWGVAALPGGRAWVGSAGDGRLFAVDLESGVHAEVAAAPADDPALLFDLELDLAHGRLLAADDRRAAILAQDMAGGELDVLLRNSIGGGEPFRRSMVVATAVDAAGRVLVLDAELGELLSVDLADGVRTLVSGAGVGGGPAFVNPVDVAFEDAAGAARALVLDIGSKTVVAVDLATGDRSVVSGAGVGNGTPFVMQGIFGSVALELSGGVAWVLDDTIQGFDNRLLSVDLQSGDRTLVSGEGLGAGPVLVQSADLALDLAGGRALTSSQKDLIAIDLATGARSVLSGAGVGAGPALGTPVMIAWDAPQQRALVYGWLGGVTAVDGATGDRIRLAVSDATKGPGLAWPMSMALWRPQPGGEPILLLGDHELTSLGALDLAIDPTSGEVPAWRAIVSR